MWGRLGRAYAGAGGAGGVMHDSRTFRRPCGTGGWYRRKFDVVRSEQCNERMKARQGWQ